MSDTPQYVILISDDELTMVRIALNGRMEVLTRNTADDAWSEPVSVKPNAALTADYRP